VDGTNSDGLLAEKEGVKIGLGTNDAGTIPWGVEFPKRKGPR